MEIITNNSNQTKKLGEFLAKKLKQRARKRALVLGLKGDLGGGKTTFLQGFAKGLGIKQKVLSPTFIIMRKFQIPKSKFQTNSKSQIAKFKTLYHIDCYRLVRDKEILDLGFKEIISDPKNIIAIEWAERIKKILPKSTIWINFEFIDKNKRGIRISKF